MQSKLSQQNLHIDPFAISGCRKSQQEKNFRKIFRPPFWRPTFFSMPWYCCAVGCKNRQGKSAERFYRFPTEVQKREAWIAAIKRKNWVPTEYSRVCSAHFVSGKSHSLVLLTRTYELCRVYMYLLTFTLMLSFCVEWLSLAFNR